MSALATPRRPALITRSQGIHTQGPARHPLYHQEKSPSIRPRRPTLQHKQSHPIPTTKILTTPDAMLDLAGVTATAPARVPNHAARPVDVEPDEDELVVVNNPHDNSVSVSAPRKRSRPEPAAHQPQQSSSRPPKRARVEEREERLKLEERFVERYTRAFPGFKFYFDSLDPAVKSSFSSRVQQLGARIEDFFSASVTHFITNKPVPSPEQAASLENKENAPSIFNPPPTRSNARPSPAPPPPGGGLLLQSPIKLKPSAPKYDSLVAKAVHFQMKTWDENKLDNILTRLLPYAQPLHPSKHQATVAVEQTQPRSRNLSTLLQAERHSGLTHERDPTVPRRDYTYFAKDSYFVLIEDLEAVHAPIIVKEYGRWKPKSRNDTKASKREEEDNDESLLFDAPDEQQDEAPWPPLRDDVGNATKAWAFLADRPPIETVDEEVRLHRPRAMMGSGSLEYEDAILAARPPKRDLRRTMSMHHIGRELDSRRPTTSGKDLADTPLLKGTKPHAFGDADYVAASGNSVAITSHIGSTTSFSTGQTQPMSLLQPQKLHQQVLTHRTFSRAAGEDTEASRPHVIRKSKSTNTMRPTNRKSRLPTREETKKPGYCENCRIRFDDFQQHCGSRKHKRFAENDAHFDELDAVLGRLARKTLEEVAREDREWYDESVRLSAEARQAAMGDPDAMEEDWA